MDIPNFLLLTLPKYVGELRPVSKMVLFETAGHLDLSLNPNTFHNIIARI
jgi:hypothetical protein